MNFINAPLIDFTIRSEIENFRTTLSELYEKLTHTPVVVPLVLNGKDIHTDEQVANLDPSTEHMIASVHYAQNTQVTDALHILSEGQKTWGTRHFSERTQILRSVADLMTAQRVSLAATMVIEAGKPWKEADADVAEAIDFCNYYADEMDRLGPVRKTSDVTGEHSTYFYQPRGIAAVISPWNFPLAIACGMTVAALVAGNTVVLKPAEQTSLVAYQFVQLLLEAGIPADAIAFLPGKGEIVGEALVQSPLIHLIVFTGSRPVGLSILQKAAVVHPGQQHIKKVIAELGGKNAIIVDEDADLDEAIKGVLYSAFGFSGQKCSACSRVIVVGDSYATFTRRLAAAAQDLIVGSAHDPAVFFGPVIDKETQLRLISQQEKAATIAECLYRGDTHEQGFIVPAAIYTNVTTDSWLWTDELFGPIIAVLQAASFEEAITLATHSEYALTGGLFSRSPKNIEHATSAYAVGNLYINRGCTGAIVCRHPFGGFKLSGVGAKAGGPDYLIQFLEPRTVTENTMRRGFTPDLTT